MKKFTVKAVDLDAELVLLDGAVVNIASPIRTARDLVNAGEKIKEATLKFMEQEKRGVGESIIYLGDMLSIVYPDHEPSWFIDNLSQEIMSELAMYVQGELTGSKVTGVK